MGSFERWIVGAMVGVLGLVALVMAGNAHDDGMHVAGLVFFIGAVLFEFRLIATATRDD